jgi:putative RecB family exonuclease
MSFRNAHLSYSRLSRFEQCPLSFKLHYIDKKTATPGIELRFGKVIHATCERIVREAIEEERVGPLDERRAFDVFQRCWATDGLTGAQLFTDGVEMVRNFVRDQGVLDTRRVLAVEKEFHLAVGRFTVLGYIDRVDVVDDETVEVIDYKSNRILFTRDEVDTSLQMSLYELAVRQLYPWVKTVKLTFWMLRHAVRISTSRAVDQLDAAKRYIASLGEQTEVATAFPARLNPNCIYCDHRQDCPAYADALAGKRAVIAKDMEDLAAVAKEREEVTRLSKILDARKRELETTLKAHLADNQELSVGGVRYTMLNVASTKYPLEETLRTLAVATELPREELLDRIAVVDKERLEKFLKDLPVERSRLNLVKAELEAKAKRTLTPRFWAKTEVAR